MKITAKTTKQELKDFLGANAKAVSKKDKNLFERLAYADAMLKKDEKQVTRRDLAELAKEVIRVLGTKVVTPALAETPTETPTPVEVKAENSVKKVKKAQEETPVEEAEKTAKKSLGKKKEAKKDGVKTSTTTNSREIPVAVEFPRTLEYGDNTFELADDIQSMDDLYDALMKEEVIIIAYYWTKRHLKQFPYFGNYLPAPKSFKDDLDITSCIFVSEEKRIAYSISSETDAIYMLLPGDIPVLSEEEPIRLAGSTEYQIYRLAE